MYKYYKVIRFTVGHIFMSFCKLEVFLECRPRIFCKIKKAGFRLNNWGFGFYTQKTRQEIRKKPYLSEMIILHS